MSLERPTPPASGDETREEVASEVVGALNAVLGFSQLLAADTGTLAAEQREEYATHVRGGARALRRLVLGVLGVDPLAADKRGSGAHAVARAAASIDDDAKPVASIAPAPNAAATVARVVVVDSDPRTRDLVVADLAGRGYEVAVFATCESATAACSARAPDLLLVAAREPDAFAVSHALRERDAYLPVVFMTDVGDERTRSHALEAGAEQILEKPIARHDLRARVKNLLNLRKNQRALAAQNEQLLRLQAFKDEMAALMVHDLKSPLSAIAMNLDVAIGGLPEEGTSDDVRGALDDCRSASARLFRMIANLLDIAKSEDGRLVARLAPVELKSLVAKIAEDHRTEARLRNVHLSWAIEVDGVFEVDADLLGRVVENLLENGMRYTRPGGKLRIVVADLGHMLEIRVANDGTPIPENARAQIFEKYGQAPTPGAMRLNRGLGLYFCRVAAEAHDGAILLGEEPEMTTCFAVRIPRKLSPP